MPKKLKLNSSYLYFSTLLHLLLILGVWGVPLTASAQQDFKSVVGDITDILLSLVPLLSSVALLLFFWGMADYIFRAGNERATEDGRQRMIWGIVGLFSIAAVWGIIRLVGGTFALI